MILSGVQQTPKVSHISQIRPYTTGDSFWGATNSQNIPYISDSPLHNGRFFLGCNKLPEYPIYIRFAPRPQAILSEVQQTPRISHISQIRPYTTSDSFWGATNSQNIPYISDSPLHNGRFFLRCIRLSEYPIYLRFAPTQRAILSGVQQTPRISHIYQIRPYTNGDSF